MKSIRALVLVLLVITLNGCMMERRVQAPDCREKTAEEMEEFERFAFELRQGADVVLTFGSYGRDFWWDINVERTWEIRDGEDIIQYFIPFPLVRDEKVLDLSGDFLHAELVGIGKEKDNFWVVVYDPPPNGQKRGHIAFSTFHEEQKYVPSRFVVMIKPKKGTPTKKKPAAAPQQEQPKTPAPTPTPPKPGIAPKPKEGYIDREYPRAPSNTSTKDDF